MAMTVVTIVAALGSTGCGGADANALFDPYDGGVDAASFPRPGLDATTPAVDATTGTAVDAAPPPVVDAAAAGFACPGAGTCAFGSQVCCHTGPNANDNECTAPDQCPGAPLSCHDSTDCTAMGKTGDACCLFLVDGGPGSSTCEGQNDCQNNGGMLLCDRALTGSCPNNETCGSGMGVIPGFGICR